MKVRETFWGIVFVLLIGFSGILTNSPNISIFKRLVYFCFLMGLLSSIWTYFSVKGFSLHRHGRGMRQQLGEVFEERFEVNNHYGLPRPWLEVRDESTLPGSGRSKVLSWIGARHQRTYSTYTLLTHRGYFHLGPTYLFSGDPFGVFSSTKKFESENSLLVLPYLVTLDDFPYPPGLLPGSKSLRHKTPEVAPHAAGVREYVPGDPLNRIHWPSTVRRDRLMVKEFEQEPQADIWIILNSQKIVHTAHPGNPDIPFADQFWLWTHRYQFELPNDTFEYGVTISASIGKYFIQIGKVVGFGSNCKNMVILPGERGERQFGKILETLSLLNYDGMLPMLGLVEAQAQHLPRGSVVILVTTSKDDSILASVNSLVRRDMHPVVIIVDIKSFGGEVEESKDYLRLKSRKIPVAIIEKGADIKNVLENGFREFQNR